MVVATSPRPHYIPRGWRERSLLFFISPAVPWFRPSHHGQVAYAVLEAATDGKPSRARRAGLGSLTSSIGGDTKDADADHRHLPN
jgi:hypothetical protein